MAQNKPLFIPWLKQQIDAGGYPGVQWVNPEQTNFSIPWKHALRQDSNSDDVLIFKAWAQTSASSDGRIPGDPSVWKRNFRSALRARHFKLLEDNKNDAANPHKVFKFPEESASGVESGDSRSASQESSPGNDIVIPYLYQDDSLFLDKSQTPDLLEQCLSGLNIHEAAQPVACPIDGLLYRDQVQFCDARFPVQETGTEHIGFLPAEGAVGGVAFYPTGEPDFPLAVPTLEQFSPHNGVFESPPCQAVVPGMGTGSPAQCTPNNSGPFETQYKVKVYYKGEKVHEQLVENSAGFQLVYRQNPNRGTGGLDVVQLPETNGIQDQTRAIHIQEILNYMGGVQVMLQEGMLYGHRWGDSRVYWGVDKHEHGTTPRQLAKNHPELLYKPKEFVSDLIKFIQDRHRCPSPSLFFCLGLQWPDPKKRPWEKMLIWIEVVMKALEDLKSIAVARGATSMQSSVELQISLEQMMDYF